MFRLLTERRFEMKKNIFIIIGLILIVGGAAISYFAGFPMADVTGFAASMFGAGAVAAGFWEKRTKTDVFSILTVACIGVGAFLLGFGGFVESTMTTIITGVIGLVGIIAGLIVGFININKKDEPKEVPVV